MRWSILPALWPGSLTSPEVCYTAEVRRCMLEIQHGRMLERGATLLSDWSHDELEPLYVFADPAGHPFCIFIAAR